MKTRLMVIVCDRWSTILKKGEVVDRYFNPGEVFDDVHLVLTNDDRPDPASMQRLVGSARLHLHNLPAGPRLFAVSLGWRPWLLGHWADRAVALAQQVRPDLIRCHGAHLNAFAAARIKARLHVPYVVSLHINPDEDVRGRAHTVSDRLAAHAQRRLEAIGLRAADRVLAVYRPIVSYLERLGIEHYEVFYNVLNPAHLERKRDYSLHDPVRIISVGRQMAAKDPSALIRAVASLPGTALTLVGDGPYHDRLRTVAAEAGAADRVRFLPSLPNDELCRLLPKQDIFATHSEYWEIAKAVLEPLLTGLPVVLNRRLGAPVPELTDELCVLVENTPEGYRGALERLMTDHAFRAGLGRNAYDHARRQWAPELTEARYADLYRQLLAEHRPGVGA
ncbi:MAG: glycosyltransferase family 4 protein [Gammaproteobacteria bacterium]|nr:glycosyltransferase family 4 protein [Gammaproteobacteria bacterium]